MSDDATKTLGVEGAEASGTPIADAAEENVSTVAIETVEVEEQEQPLAEPDPSPVAEETRTTSEVDRDEDNPTLPKSEAEKPNENAQDRKLTRENASLRKRLREVESVLREKEEAELSEQERQARRLAEMEEKFTASEQRLRESSLSLAVSSAAARLNVVDPDAAVKLIDTSTLEYDPDKNHWIGIDEAMSDLVEERSWLVRTPGKPAPPKEASPANPARRRTRLTREAMAKMTQAEIDALPWEDVQAALASDD
jgi:hypothetical protein